jgi:hypothetical protein
MKHKLISALICTLFVACSVSKNKPSKLHYRNEVMYHQARNYRDGSGFHLFPDSSQAVFIPRSRKGSVMMYYRIDNDFIYIP